MQPARLGALSGWCFANALLALLFLAPSSRAQTATLETPQQTNDRIRQLSASARTTPHDYIIGNGDLLLVEVFDVQELTRDIRVSQTGTIGIPLVPVRLRVSGLSEIQAEQKIAEVLEANGLVSHPQVTVTVKERKSKPITVVGAVGHPMVYQADHPVTLLEVLAEAGGLAGDAGDTVIVTRPTQEPAGLDASQPPAIGPEMPVRAAAPPKDASQTSAAQDSASSAKSLAAPVPGSQPVPPSPAQDPAQAPPTSEPPALNNIITVNLNELMEAGNATNNVLLQSGDIVTVPHSGIVYVLGSVAKPGGFVLANDRSRMTTLKVLALAGGLNRTAKRDHAVIIRRDSLGQQHEVAVDLKRVLDRSTEDVQLQPSDILFVPDSAGKQALIKAAEFGVAIASGVALYRLAYH